MPIVFVHGVANRDESSGYAESIERIKTLMLRYIAPAISADPGNVAFLPAYWGDLGVRFAWGRASRPLGPLLGMGGAELSQLERAVAVAEAHGALADLPAPSAPVVDTGDLVAAGASGGHQVAPASLAALEPDELSNLLVTLALRSAADEQQSALLSLAADDVASDPSTRDRLRQCQDSAAELALIQELLAERYQQLSGGELVGQGGMSWLGELGDRLGEALSRADDLPGFVLTRAAAEARGPINAFVSLFLGDVLNYIDKRGTAENPGPIPLRVLDTLAQARDVQQARGGEPLVVVSHSMGGQIVYDLVTHFLPNLAGTRFAGIRIDFWCATASQVGLFEEMKQFRASSRLYGKDIPPATADRVPFPDRRSLGGWWNVWDHNDFISFTAADIIAGVDDEAYDSGMSGLGAHSGYLVYPTFFRRFAEKLVAAKASNWWRP